MNTIEVIALGVIASCAVALVLLAIAWEARDRRTPPPETLQHRPKHADWGETTRLRPPD